MATHQCVVASVLGRPALHLDANRRVAPTVAELEEVQDDRRRCQVARAERVLGGTHLDFSAQFVAVAQIVVGVLRTERAGAEGGHDGGEGETARARAA